MKKLLALLCLTLTCLAHAAERPDAGKYVKAYSGNEGVKVWITRVGPAEKAEVLLQVTGIDHPWDGLIQKARVENRDLSRRYIIRQNGQDYIVLALDRDSGTLFLPYQPDNLRSLQLKYDENLSSRGNPQHFLTEWLEQNEKKR